MMITLSTLRKIAYLSIVFFAMASFAHAEKPIVMFSDMTDGPTTGWEQSTNKGAAVSVWCRNIGTSRGSSYVSVGGVNLTNDTDYAEWGATTNPTVPLGMQRITFFLNSSMTTSGTYPNTTITVTTADGTSDSIPFHCRELADSSIYYLDNVNGSDSNSGLTAAQAKRTTAWARGNLEAGDVCYLKGSGTPYTDHDKGSMYHAGGLFSFGGGSNPNHNNGIEGKSISVSAFPGDHVEMKANEESTSLVLKSCIYMYYGGSQVEFWTFSKFTMEATWAAVSLGGNGFTGGGVSHFRVIGNDATTKLTSTGQWGNIIVAYGNSHGMDHLYVYGNYLHDQCADFRGQDTGRRVYQIYIGGYGSLNHIYIGWNDMGWGSQGRGFQIYGHNPADSLDNFHVHNNWFHDNVRQNVILGGGDGSSAYGFVKTCYFYNNILSNPGNGDPAIVIGGVGNGRYGGDFYLYNNIIHSADYAYPTIQLTGHINSMTLRNNIIYGYPNSWDYYTYYPDSVPSNLTADHNLYYGAGENAVPSWDNSTLSNDDPKFVNSNPVSFLDFKMQPDSPLVGAGIDTTAIVKTDFLGLVRSSASLSIGAFEEGMSSVIPPVTLDPPTNLRIE